MMLSWPTRDGTSWHRIRSAGGSSSHFTSGDCQLHFSKYTIFSHQIGYLQFKFVTCSRAVRYEDLSVEPHRGVQELFQFFGLDFHPNIQLFLDTHTKVNVGGVSSTYRNSKSAPFHWRQDLTHSEVRAIQRACAPAMHYWGYRRAANSSHQKDFNPLGEFSLS